MLCFGLDSFFSEVKKYSIIEEWNSEFIFGDNCKHFRGGLQ